jgi:tetratricopeptide (TPR) repeat protein
MRDKEIMKPALFVYLALLCLFLLSSTQVGCASQNDNQTSADVTPSSSESSNINNSQVSNSDAEQNQSTTSPQDAADAQGYLAKGVEAYKKNRDEEAVEAFQQATRLDPDLAEAHYRLGLACDAMQMDEESDKAYERAANVYKKILRRGSKDAQAHFFLGLTYDKLGKEDEAVKAFKEAARHEPDDPIKLYELGLAHSKLAQYKEAVNAFNKALELDPDDFRSSEALEKAKAGLARREAFLKQQEKLDKQKQAKPKKSENTNINTNASTRATPKTP